MKRSLALALCIVAAAAVAGCGSKKSTNPILADTNGATVEVGLGNADLGAGNYAGANQHYHAALDKDPNNKQARLGVALTDLYLVQNDSEVQNIVSYFNSSPPPAPGKGADVMQRSIVAGLDPARVSFMPLDEGQALVRMLALATTNPPAISEIQRVIATKVLPKLQSAENHLNVIEQSGDFVFKLPPSATGLADSLEIDNSDVLLLDSVVNGVEGWLGLIVAYNFDVENNDFQNVDAESLLAPGTAWATLHTGGALVLSDAKQNLLLVKTRLDQAAVSLAAETDDQTDDLISNLWLNTATFTTLHDQVAWATSTLEGSVTITVKDRAGQPFDMALYLGRFFVPAIEDLKTKAPDHTFDVNGDPQIVSPITFPDPTINGIFPDMTNDRWRALTGINVIAARTPR